MTSKHLIAQLTDGLDLCHVRRDQKDAIIQQIRNAVPANQQWRLGADSRSFNDVVEWQSLKRNMERVAYEARYTRQSVVASLAPPPPPSVDKADDIRCRIDNDTIVTRLRSMAHLPVLESLEMENIHIGGFEVKTNYLHLYCRTAADVEVAKTNWSKIQHAFGLPEGCEITRDRFVVRAMVASDAIRRELSYPLARSRCCERIAREYEVNVRSIFISYGHVIVEFASKPDALKFRLQNDVFICGYRCSVHAFDLRSLPMLCRKCGKPGHMAASCKAPEVCLKCASTGHRSNFCFSAKKKCVNCGQGHETWWIGCEDPQVVKMMKKCREWALYGAEWSPLPEAVGRAPPRPLMAQPTEQVSPYEMLAKIGTAKPLRAAAMDARLPTTTAPPVQSRKAKAQKKAEKRRAG